METNENRSQLKKYYKQVKLCPICKQFYGSDCISEEPYCPEGRCGK